MPDDIILQFPTNDRRFISSSEMLISAFSYENRFRQIVLENLYIRLLKNSFKFLIGIFNFFDTLF